MKKYRLIEVDVKTEEVYMSNAIAIAKEIFKDTRMKNACLALSVGDRGTHFIVTNKHIKGLSGSSLRYELSKYDVVFTSNSAKLKSELNKLNPTA